jgi:hypothetical protein
VAVRLRISAATGHHVGVDVDGIAGVGDQDPAIGPEDLLDVPAVLLAAVRDEDLVGLDRDAARLIVVPHDRVDEKVVASLGPVAVCALGHVLRGVVERADDGWSQRQRNVADAETDHRGIGVRLREDAHPSADLRKQVAGLKLTVVVVDVRHGPKITDGPGLRE